MSAVKIRTAGFALFLSGSAISSSEFCTTWTATPSICSSCRAGTISESSVSGGACTDSFTVAGAEEASSSG